MQSLILEQIEALLEVSRNMQRMAARKAVSQHFLGSSGSSKDQNGSWLANRTKPGGLVKAVGKMAKIEATHLKDKVGLVKKDFTSAQKDAVKQTGKDYVDDVKTIGKSILHRGKEVAKAVSEPGTLTDKIHKGIGTAIKVEAPKARTAIAAGRLGATASGLRGAAAMAGITHAYNSYKEFKKRGTFSNMDDKIDKQDHDKRYTNKPTWDKNHLEKNQLEKSRVKDIQIRQNNSKDDKVKAKVIKDNQVALDTYNFRKSQPHTKDERDAHEREFNRTFKPEHMSDDQRNQYSKMMNG